MKEVIGQTQTDRRVLGSTTAKWWSKSEGKEKRDMIIDEIRNKTDSTRVQKGGPAASARVLQELASVISTAKGEIHPSSTSSTVFTTEGGVKKWHGGSIPINTHRKGLLDGCDDWVVSADLPALNGKDTLMLSERQH
ncbi:reverse transcriptase [Plakobranchus ocellatus]|uniref:Reverse transcriptase n=1 Tax=Plakobranchus ocellatus TaxID=259542 RepID=A0AAV3XWC6_9GAST|nr:reverse transcriptase [Plakobranchus ocellatus]